MDWASLVSSFTCVHRRYTGGAAAKNKPTVSACDTFYRYTVYGSAAYSAASVFHFFYTG